MSCNYKTAMLSSFKVSHPVFFRTCSVLEKTIFYKNIESLIKTVPINTDLAESLCCDALKMCDNNWDLYENKLESLLSMNIEFLKLQALLEKDKRYLYSSFAEVEKHVFKKKQEGNESGVDYLWGLYFTQIFWVTHHNVFNFFLDSFVATSEKQGLCLDVPSGSGMFLAQFLQANSLWTGEAVDLSDSSISLTKKLFSAKDLLHRVSIEKKDFFDYGDGAKFDRIICTEFLEHVENPLSVLKKLHELLAPAGELFLTTVVWAAFTDHIFLYRNAEEIRRHIHASGFRIKKELVQVIFEKDKGKETESDIALNYAVLLTKL